MTTWGLLVGTLVAGQADLRASSLQSCRWLALREAGQALVDWAWDPPGEAGSTEVEACSGGDVVEAGVQEILMALAEIGFLIYPRELAFCITDTSELPSHED